MPAANTHPSFHPGNEKASPQKAKSSIAKTGTGHASANPGASEAAPSPSANAAQTESHFRSVIETVERLTAVSVPLR